MTVCRLSRVVIALSALLIGAACSDRDAAELPAETDEALFVQGMQLKNQGRNAEALTAFLKVIEKRGERAASESHLEAGTLYLRHLKDPVAAYYHFRKYLELQPNSKEAPYVRGMVDAAKRDFFRSLAGAPKEDQSVRLAVAEEIEKLRRENEELRAEVKTLRGIGAVTGARQATMITLPDELKSRPASAPPVNVVDAEAIVPAPAAVARPTPPSGPSITLPTTSKSAPPARPAANAARGNGGVTHTVRPQESLFSIAKRYNVKLEDLTRANGIRDPNRVPAGTVLRIP